LFPDIGRHYIILCADLKSSIKIHFELWRWGSRRKGELPAAASGAAASSDEEEAASQDSSKNKGENKPEKSKSDENGVAQAAAEKVIQHYNAAVAAEARPPSKPAKPAPPSQASTSSAVTERQRVMEWRLAVGRLHQESQRRSL
jgi:hypothetical protein